MRLALAIGLVACLLAALAPAAAHAAPGIGVSPGFPATTSLGSTAVPGSLTLTNTNTGDDGSSTVCNFLDSGPCAGSQGITLVPSCAEVTLAGCVSADRGVFAINSPATGATGTACAGRFFAVSEFDATYGTVRFTPTTGNIVLPTPGSTCRIDFTFTVAQSPAIDARPATPGRQTLSVAEASVVSDQGVATTSRVAGAAVRVTLAPPTVTATVPGSPANDNAPKVKGNSPAGTQTVAVYPDASCSGVPAASGTAAAFASPGFTVAVADDSTQTFHATGTDGDGGVTPCSPAGVTYVEDSTAPVAPTLEASVPASPANSNSPLIKGTAEASSTVRIYTNAGCSSTIAAQGSATTFGATGLAVSLDNDSTTTFHATATDAAGNISACSESSITYVEDSTPPSPPSVPVATPSSPTSENTPHVSGTAPAGTTVRIYTDPACAGDVAASGSAATYVAPGIAVTVPSNSTTRFYATASDAAGNASTCSPGSAAYVEDSVAPSAPGMSGSQPASPSSANSTRIKGGAESGSTVRLYTDPACSGTAVAEGTAAEFASPGLLVTVADNSSTTYYASATDTAGNASACSAGLVYVEDSSVPSTLIDNTPAVGSTPTFTFASDEPGTTFECRLDNGVFMPCTSPYTVPAGLPAGAHTFEVRAVDSAGNRAPAVARAFTVTATPGPPPATTPPPPATAPKRAQPGCTKVVGTVYVGTSAANARTGSRNRDIMFGLGGSDRLSGASGADCLYGGDAADTLRGGNGSDRMYGGTGSDRLDGNAGNDRLSGQSGNDRIYGGAGKDQMFGAAGRDTMTDRRAADVFSGGSGNDRIDARDLTAVDRRSRDRIRCGTGRDVVFADRRDTVSRDCERVVRRSLGVRAAR